MSLRNRISVPSAANARALRNKWLELCGKVPPPLVRAAGEKQTKQTTQLEAALTALIGAQEPIAGAWRFPVNGFPIAA